MSPSRALQASLTQRLDEGLRGVTGGVKNEMVVASCGRRIGVPNGVLDVGEVAAVLASEGDEGVPQHVRTDRPKTPAVLARRARLRAKANLDGDSYRLREHQARGEALRKTTTGTRTPLR